MNLEKYLNKLVEENFLKKEKIGADQIKSLFLSARKNLKSAQININIDEETCYAMAYTSMLKIGRAVIYAKGFRPAGNRQHKITVDVSGAILGKECIDLITQFDKMRRKRNQFTYEPLLPLSKEETKKALKTAELFFIQARNYFDKVNFQQKLF